MEAGVDLIGVNFFPGSKRFLTFERAREWLPDFAGAIQRVAVFVRPEWSEVCQVAEAGVVDMIQLHGGETPGFTGRVASLGLPVIYALKATADGAIDPAIHDMTCKHFLIDSSGESGFGGTGVRIPCASLLKMLACQHIRGSFIAGGLTPENVAEVVNLSGVGGVDVAGGVEVRPGIKSSEKIQEFVDAVRNQKSYSHDA